MGYNPQYALTVESGSPISARIVLTRHITAIKDFAENEEYITLHVFPGGKRVYYLDNPVSMGTKINSPHYTVKLDLPPGKHTFTLVVSQYEKSATIRYTIEAFSTAALSLAPIAPAYPPSMENRIVSSWTAENAGGCPNDRASFETNPKFSFTVHDAFPSCRTAHHLLFILVDRDAVCLCEARGAQGLLCRHHDTSVRGRGPVCLLAFDRC